MDRILVFVAAVLPAFAVLLYGVIKTRGEWNETLWNSFLIGGVAAAACIPVELALSYLLTPTGAVLGALSKAVLVAAIPEEFAKFFVLIGVAERDVDARRKQDILLLALGVSLGFATLENIFFVASNTDWQMVAAGRAVTAVPGHAVDGLIMGALLTAARLQGGRHLMLLALAIPVLMHAAYDFPLFLLKTDFKIWALVLWFAVLLLSAILAICLCNRFLPAAALADAACGKGGGTAIRARYYFIGGMALIAASIAVATVAVLTKFNNFAWLGVIVATLPVALGLDLVWAGLRRKRSR